ncbi:hypothetical protein CGLO_13765 [Colletotrichum gloeosporioides Cg-14]|uniref:Uncharacterized protein n=1 Tax=Colletotrichum gloeosporioides (strain Cg-14) TaxID=1237896 RepID=T0JVU3_COLGC|nr:hypothetical protein CGLO_13765 [Colletotrichum gloeosporioides Cg-14]
MSTVEIEMLKNIRIFHKLKNIMHFKFRQICLKT